jgi:hypothetical protein
MKGDYSSDESSESDDEGSKVVFDDDVLTASSESLYLQVRMSTEAIPDDAFEIFTFWLPKIWENYTPCVLNDVVHVLNLLSPDPATTAFASKHESRDPDDKLTCERLIVQLFVPNDFLHIEEQEQEKLGWSTSFGRNIMTSG